VAHATATFAGLTFANKLEAAKEAFMAFVAQEPKILLPAAWSARLGFERLRLRSGFVTNLEKASFDD
jgi:hypothetical protein